jgi:copper(I)-binding protein
LLRALGAAAFCGLLATATASAQEYKGGDVAIHQPFATPTRPGASTGAAYFVGLENRGALADRLLRASSPAAGRVELHSGEIGTDGVMRMRELDAIALPAGTTVELKPGQGYHLMLMDLKAPLAQGASFPMTLEFERAGKIEVKVVVREQKPGSGHSAGHRP